jgi:hypothetical protein
MKFEEFRKQVEGVCEQLADLYTHNGKFDAQGFGAALAELVQSTDPRPLADLTMQWRRIEHGISPDE